MCVCSPEASAACMKGDNEKYRFIGKPFVFLWAMCSFLGTVGTVIVVEGMVNKWWVPTLSGIGFFATSMGVGYGIHESCCKRRKAVVDVEMGDKDVTNAPIQTV